MAKKSLSDEISSLFTRKSDYDIEDLDSGRQDRDIFQHQEGEQDDESETLESDEESKKQHYVSSSKSKLRTREGVSLGKRYTGDVVSRKDLYDQPGAEEDKDDGEDEEDENENEELEPQEFSDAPDGTSESPSEPEDDDEEAGYSAGESPNQSSASHHKKTLIKQLMEKERSHIVKRLSQSAIDDSLKGYAVQKQHKTYDKIVDIRIKFQKSVNAANKLPYNANSYQDHKSDASDELVQDAKSQLYNVLQSIFKLRSQLEQTPIKPPSSKKRTLKEYSLATGIADERLQSQRSNILNKWSTKLQNSSGSSAINAGKFKTINQSFEQQVKNNLSDMDRLVKRTKLNRKQISPLGYTESQETNTTPPLAESDIPVETTRKTKTQGQEIEHIFDDEDFYRVLLNDLVDRKVQSSDPTSNTNITLVKSAQKVNKLSNNVDTKASKGRKLRFHVQDQIANFESSTGGWKWNDDQIDEFFASLLGQKVNMNEEENTEAEDGDEQDLIVDDGLRLFGHV
ncbi:uncharacterized protein LODBEIA_P19990 [Lodderomyces beijingensis]|uniref:Protein BFR2 n=1 Tax=Lodderomyces beijingensis TaxID=1775926 RepID=A0ABP0ZKP7_9ASCO